MARGDVPPQNVKWRDTLRKAKEQGIPPSVLASTLGISTRRLQTLAAGRDRPSLGETSKLTARRRTTLIRYKDIDGENHAFYTGRGISIETLINTEQIPLIAGEIAERNHYKDYRGVFGMEDRYPSHPPSTRIYSVLPTWRERWPAPIYKRSG